MRHVTTSSHVAVALLAELKCFLMKVRRSSRLASRLLSAIAKANLDSRAKDCRLFDVDMSRHEYVLRAC
jgi:hypothetical protein